MINVTLSAADYSVIDAALRDRVAILQGAAAESMRRGDRHHASLKSQGAGSVQKLQRRLMREVEAGMA